MDKASAQRDSEKNISLLVELENQLLQTILTVMQEGICLLSTDMDILYANPAMRYWYELTPGPVWRKCYEAYHGRTTPCAGCPALRAIASSQSETAEMRYEKDTKREGWRDVFCVPIFDDSGRVIMILEYVRDTTGEKRSALSIELLNKQLENQISAMTEREIENHIKHQNLLGSINRSIDAVLLYLENVLDAESFLVVKKHLELTAGHTEQRIGIPANLTEKEYEIARYIAQGYLSKEIADQLHISKKTVDYHRNNLRKRLGLQPKDDLKSALQKLMQT